MKINVRNISFGFMLLLGTSECSAYEYANSVGFGLQYGGIIGWQGSISEDNLHGRVAVGLVGLSLGGDLDLNKYFSVGATATTIGIAKFTSLNLNYYPGGRYTSGWRVGLDFGFGASNIDDEDRGSFVAASFGYSFN